ncbi:MAG: acyl-CoA dehydrogenase family protein [Acidimicrobiales bacterium]
MTLSATEGRTQAAELAERVGAETAAVHAADVDRQSRFPVEAIDEIRSAGLLSAMIPERLGGGGAGLVEIADATFALARHCASTAMIFAMHQLQIACLVRHGSNDFLEQYLRDVAQHQLLIGSATTERGVGGDTGSSVCAVNRTNGRYNLEKFAPVISYGRYADSILLTARRTPESPPHDQVMVLCMPPGLLLEQTNGWNAMGFRGTCSSGFRVVAEGDENGVVPDPFDVIAAQTNTPAAHILWTHVWLGLAAEATYQARAYVQGEARKRPGETPASARALARLDTVYMQMAALVRESASSLEATWKSNVPVSSIGSTATANALKVSASTLVVEIVGQALNVCGMAGYMEDSPFSMGRILRDSYGAALMINNDRLLDNNARLLLMDKRTL